MKVWMEKLPTFEQEIRKLRDILIANIVLVGQIPAPTFGERDRAEFFLDRMTGFQVDECALDSYGNAIGIIRGNSRQAPPIFVVAHLDTFLDAEIPHDYFVTEHTINGPGVSDNSAGVGVLLTLPEVFTRLNLKFDSDIVLVGTVESLGKGNLKGIRKLLQSWSTPIRGAICVEGVDLGKLSYYSDGMIRGEIDCTVSARDGFSHLYKPNAILIINEVVNKILELRLPQRPQSHIVIGKIKGGFNHGKIAYEANLGFEIRSDSDRIVREIYYDIRDIVEGINKEFDVDLSLSRISNLNATRLPYNHPLVKSADNVLRKLEVEPVREPSESAQSIFLHKGIPAVTLGITFGSNFRQTDAAVQIEPMFKGITQVVGVLMAIDNGVCDE